MLVRYSGRIGRKILRKTGKICGYSGDFKIEIGHKI